MQEWLLNHKDGCLFLIFNSNETLKAEALIGMSKMVRITFKFCKIIYILFIALYFKEERIFEKNAKNWKIKDPGHKTENR